MAKKTIAQPELPIDTTAGATTAPMAEEIAAVDLIDDEPDTVTSDLRKFNRARAEVNKAVAPLKLILTIVDAAGVTSAMEHMKKAKKVENLIENKRKDLVKPYNSEVSRINAYASGLSRQIPDEIDRVKKLILDYDTAQAIEAKKKTTDARHQHLLDLGMVRMDKGAGTIAVDHYHDAVTDCKIYRADLEAVSEPVWIAILQNMTNRRAEEQQKAVGQLQQAKEAAVFFGDEQDAAMIDEKIAAIAQPSRPTPSYSGSSFAAPKTQGLTKRWTFKVVDETLIPRAYLMIDDKKVKDEIAGGARSIPGLEIFQSDSITLR